MKWKFGIWDGLLQSLSQIDRAGGAFLRSPLWSPFEYGGEITEAAIIPAYTYIALLGISLPCPYWDLVGCLPELSFEHHGQTMVWRPVNIYRTTTLLAFIPLAVSALPADNPLQDVPP